MWCRTPSIASIFCMLVVVRLVNAADVQMSWPSCATSRLSVLLSGTQLGALTPYEALGSPFYQPVATFVGSVCGTTPGTYCLTPNNTPNANTYATVATRFVVSGTANAPAPGTLVTARFSAQFLDHTDNYNEYVYGLQLWTFLGDYTPLGSEPKGATFSLSTGSLLGNFKYPDWDVITPMALVFPLNTSHVCDSLIMFNENSSTPCKFYNDTPFTSALRWPRFDVEVVFNMTGVSNYLVSAIVRYNGSNMLFNLTNLQPHWTAIPATPDGNNQVFGFISARSSVELSNISVTATLNCPPTTKSTTSLTATTVVPTSTTVVQTSSSSSSTSPPGVPVTPITSTLTSGSLTSTESSNATNPDNPTINLRANDNTRSRNATDDTALFTALFVTFAVICCCVLMCTLFRKRIRRSRPMKALYFSTPKPLRAALCMLCIKIDHETGATYEEVIDDIPFDAVDLGGNAIRNVIDDDDDDDDDEKTYPNTAPPSMKKSNARGTHRAEQAGVVASRPAGEAIYSLVQVPSQRRRGDSGTQNTDGYSALPASAATTALPPPLNGTTVTKGAKGTVAAAAAAATQPPPPPPSGVQQYSTTAARANVNYDRVMVTPPSPPRYDGINSKFD